jgi:hypothetical protein
VIDDQIILISYPSGGFGNFIYHALSEFSDNTYKVANNNFTFSLDGNSHATRKYMTPYFFEPDDYRYELPDTDKLCLVLCDNGIVNDSYLQLRQVFPTARIIRTNITESMRPVIYQTCVIKAQQQDLVGINAQHIHNNWQDADHPHAVREHFTLLYHDWKFGWNPTTESRVVNIELEHLITQPVACLLDIIGAIDGRVTDLEQLQKFCQQWHNTNKQYFQVYHDWHEIRNSLIQGVNSDISDITDLHTQGYINYCIERDYCVTIPVYDYRDWFTSTDQIKEMIQCLK